MRKRLGCSASNLRLEFDDERLERGPFVCPGRKFPPRMMEQILPMLQSVGVYGVGAQSASTPDGRHQIVFYAAVQLHLEPLHPFPLRSPCLPCPGQPASLAEPNRPQATRLSQLRL